MKILIATGIYPPDVGGPATYSKILFEELPKHGIEVEVLSFGKVRHLPKLIRHSAYFIKVLRLGGNADIIFAQDPISVGFPAMLSAKILRKKFLLKIVGDYAWEQGAQRFGVKEVLDDFLNKKYGWRVEFLKKIEKMVANSAEKIIVPSEYLKRVVTKWEIDERKIFVVYNAFDAPRIEISKLAARKELNINDTDKMIVSAGRDVPWKGFETLKNIFPEISTKFPGAKLFILTKEPKERLVLYLLAADVFVLNTAYEGFSHQILEAMAIGVPIVTTNAGGNPELIKDGESGFLVNFNDKNALKQRIFEIFNNSALAQKFSENAQKKAREFSLERMTDETIKILRNL